MALWMLAGALRMLADAGWRTVAVAPSMSWMMWKGFEPIVYHLTSTDEKGLKVDAETLAEFRVDWHPLEDLPKWAMTRHPTVRNPFFCDALSR